MSSIFLRVTKRKTAWEVGVDFETTLQTEFKTYEGKLDLSPSVYEIDLPSSVIRVHAEHAANANLDPPRGGNNVDLSGAAIVKKANDSRFQFTRDAHRELSFQNEDELREFVGSILGNLNNLIYRTQQRELLSYVKKSLDGNDPEWKQFCQESLKGKNWGCS